MGDHPVHADLWDFARRLRALRLARGFSQAALAEAAEISQKAVQRYETAREEPRLSTLPRLAAALGVTVGQLAGDA